MSQHVKVAQRTFLENYLKLLQEVEGSFSFVLDCYKQGNEDIGDRLLQQMMMGLLPYNTENMTVASIFGHDDASMEALRVFHKEVHIAIKIDEEMATAEEKSRFVHEVMQPRIQQWRNTVHEKLTELL
ncbi:hypothetical protein Bcell_3598 [Evansella cellulosilytica DSM 2522]|uniref:DUF8042 domain-containing protein n=2 Tax=Evansella TaxID=2837485 RepID=E6TS70_EVAC2|nr:hypothetical protein Bcell_3598 [Evansella cellulosilytica DSM 2522]